MTSRLGTKNRKFFFQVVVEKTMLIIVYLSVPILLITSLCCNNFPPKSIEWFIEGHAFSRSYDLALPPSHLPPVSKLDSDTQEDCQRDTTCWRERGRGWARIQIIRLPESLVFYKSFNTLCFPPYLFPYNALLLILAPSSISFLYFSLYLKSILLFCPYFNSSVIPEFPWAL